MAILNKYKRWVPMLIPIEDEYWDFVLSQDDSPSFGNAAKLTEKCLSSYIDFGDENCQETISNYSGFTINGVHSYDSYTWEECLNDGAELDDIGYTGIDNGFIYYGGYDRVTNKEFYEIFTDSHIPVESGDCRLHLHAVTGNTGVFSYDMEYISGNYYALKGGFFQGFYKLFGFDYQVLPQYIENEWNVEVELRPRDYEEQENTLNSTHPNNKGIFFYMGTRAEDKFLRIYNTDLSKYETREQPINDYCDSYFSWDEDEELIEAAEKAGKLNRIINIISARNLTYFLNTYGYKWDNNHTYYPGNKPPMSPNPVSQYLGDDDYYEEDIIISGSTIITSNGVPLDDSGYYEIKTDNKFILFDRTNEGFTTVSWEKLPEDQRTYIVLTGSTNDLHTGNLFLIMDRTCSGYTTETLADYYSDNKPLYNFTGDTINNAFALKYNEDGSIGYRYLVLGCKRDDETEEEYKKRDKIAIFEERSLSGLVNPNEWATINVKFSILNGDFDRCGKPIGQRKMKIFIYVNGYLKFISKELPEFNFRELKTVAEKQEGVPFNISIGGGTQGLCDSVWVDYNKTFEKILPIEKNFAGTFIGDIKRFRFYTCKLQLAQIRNNALYNKINRI